MPVTYTNCKGRTYYLCRGVTKTGKPRYYFSREPKGEPVEEMPEGYEIRESVNGVVSLAKKRPTQLSLREIEAVEAAVERHPKAENYRVDAKQDRITVYERVGPGAGDLIADFERAGLMISGRADRLREILDRRARFTPVMRFTLVDAERRRFGVQRMLYRGGRERWIDLTERGPVDKLARRLIPLLGTEQFFELI